MSPLILLASASLAASPYTPTGQVLGTAHPMFPQAWAEDGSWVAACQARHDTDGNGEIAVFMGHHGDAYGDERRLYLLDAAQPEGLAGDRVVSHDDQGRFLLWVREGRLKLRDTRLGHETDLGEAPPRHGLHERAGDIDAAGEWLVRLAGDGQVLLREIATGAERPVPVGPGLTWRAHFAAPGLVSVAAVRDDTDGDGQLTLPTVRTTLSADVCRGQALSYSTYGYGGDAWTSERAWLDGRPERRAIVASAGGDLVYRSESGTLIYDGDTEFEIAPASCAAEVAAIWPEGDRAVIACADGKDRWTWSWRGDGVAAPLALPGTTRPWGMTVDRVFVPTGEEIVDLATGRILERAYGGEVATWGDVLVDIDRQHRVRLRDLALGTTTYLIEGETESAWKRDHGRFGAVVRDGKVYIVDLAQRRVLGTLPRPPLLVRDDGAALVPEGSDQHDMGPLRWWTPPR
ncbi:MAG: hypothetical protein FJ102_14760 [Deltaproteobacteria bacterium]|nr:hypothetical protein [Deltaproteobacteria bacterium]